MNEAEKISLNYTLPELEDMIERAEMFMHRSNDSVQKQVWKDRLVTYYAMRNLHEDFKHKK